MILLGLSLGAGFLSLEYVGLVLFGYGSRALARNWRETIL